MARVNVRNLSKSFGAVEVLRDINVTAEDGEFIVLVGPSGCGKTTLLRIIAGLEEATEGEIAFGDRPVTHLAPSKRGAAMVFQSYALYPHKSVAENMGFGLKMSGQSRTAVAERVGAVARTLQLDQLLDRKPRELSGGQRQRVAIGRAIARRPDVFLFDEPLSNLDAALRVEMRLELAKIHKDLGATIIYVTHDQVEAMTLATKIVVMRDGNVEQIGSPSELYKRPANKFVASFLGMPQMNFLKAATLGSVETQRVAEYGIRPEHIRLAPALAEEIALNARVAHAEFLGATQVVYLELGTKSQEQKLVCMADPDADFSIGSDIEISFSLRNCRPFDHEGNAIG